MKLGLDSVVTETLIILHCLSEPSAAEMTRTGNHRVYFKEEMGAAQVGVVRDGGPLSMPSSIILWDAYFDSNNYYHPWPKSYSIQLHYEKYSCSGKEKKRL